MPDEPDDLPIVIRPSRWKKAALFVPLLAVMLAACIITLMEGERLFTQLIGALGIVFFGVGGIFALYRMLRRSWSLALDRDGIRLNHAGTEAEAALLPWVDIEDVAVLAVSKQKMVGIRLSSYDAYLSNRAVRRGGRIVAAATQVANFANDASVLPDAGPIDYLNDAHDHAEGRSALKPWKGARDAAGVMRGTRAAYGYDLALPWTDFDRPADQMAQLIRKHWIASRRNASIPVTPV